MCSDPDRIAPAPLRVVVIDDRTERRSLMVDVVEGDDGSAAVVAQADTAEAALLSVDQEEADAVLIDLRMPGAEGLRTIRRLHERFPRLGIVACSFDVDRRTVGRAVEKGAHAFVPKPAYHAEVFAALERARRAAQASPTVVAVVAS